MPQGLVRFYGDGDLHFITCSCRGRQPILNAPARRDLLLDILDEVRVRYRVIIGGYVVMPEHFHMLMSEPQIGNPSTVMQVLKQRFSRQISDDAVWEERFYDFNVWSPKKRVEKLRYIHRNPVKRGLVELPRQWEWSSFRFYLTGEIGRVRVNDHTVMKLIVRPPAA